ncbi:DUF1192 domain-containing protein [Pelagibacterium sp. 26DY04]|uniref:DUF1192 domain-containing protein n=1 Tax=unclassified Pelagibacterium TaxID=2623280 RepID=UPI0028152080|nr:MULTISPECIES: DUF1192 domain-containing protein [unclassified Pelagibacterium]WMT86327.1 DUF1192 domain-containing protein [Pelagibacterium sp. 26DY04]WMT89429.1 DUF1192 domain-containing protein [Pelagibacterium sp. H642]
MDEDEVRRQPVHEVGMPLDALSVDELTDRISLLQNEIARLERAIESKNASRSAADAVFKF